MVDQLETLLKENLTFDALTEKIIEEEANANVIKDKVVETRNDLLPIRSLMNDLIFTLANLESMGNKTSQEKFLAVRMKLIELQNNIQKMSRDFQSIQPLIGTMESFNQEVTSEGKKFFVSDTLGYALSTNPVTAVPAATMTTKGVSPKKSVPAKTTSTTPQAAVRWNSAAKKTVQTTGVTPNLKQIPASQSIQLMPGVSPMAVTSPLNNISPQRKRNSLMAQSREGSLHTGATPSASMITPQNILNMSSFDLNQNQTPQSLDNVNNGMDLANIDLDSLNMDFLN